MDACHQLGLAVVMDVVYNHLGPEGNYLPEYAPASPTRITRPGARPSTSTGPQSDGVRRWVIDNALYWLTEYHVDALRLDAIHGIYDFGASSHPRRIVGDISRVRPDDLQRQAWIIAESDLEDVRIINPRAAGGYALDAQWHDDFHHALYALLTGSGKAFSWISARCPS